MTEVNSKNLDTPAVRTAADGSVVRVAEQDRIMFTEEYDDTYHRSP